MIPKLETSYIKQAKTEAVQEIAQAARDAVKTLADAANSATKDISTAAGGAVKVLADAAGEAAKVVSVNRASGQNDHDLLIEIKTRLEGLTNTIREEGDGIRSRVRDLEIGKLDASDSYPNHFKSIVDNQIKDHENRLRENSTAITKLMSYGSALIVLVGIFEFIIGSILHH